MKKSKQIDCPTYVTDAIESFRVIMSKRKGGNFDEIMKEQKGESFILHVLSKKAEMLPSELSTALGSSAARISAVLGTLEKKGQVERRIDPDNRRNILVSITDSGRDRVEVEMRKWTKTLEHVFLDMGEIDTKEYLRLSSQFFQLLQEHLKDFDNK